MQKGMRTHESMLGLPLPLFMKIFTAAPPLLSIHTICLIVFTKKTKHRPGVAVHIYDLRTREAEAGGLGI